ncbi:hypothetical protein G6F68_018916 [Rhizopus microsporus]|nr:hypothetical protein G6F68_018916 [Rhizopus microsporus]
MAPTHKVARAAVRAWFGHCAPSKLPTRLAPAIPTPKAKVGIDPACAESNDLISPCFGTDQKDTRNGKLNHRTPVTEGVSGRPPRPDLVTTAVTNVEHHQDHNDPVSDAACDSNTLEPKEMPNQYIVQEDIDGRA